MMHKYYTIVIVSIVFFLGCKQPEKYYYSTGELSSTVEINDEGKNHGKLKVFSKTGKLKAVGLYTEGKKNGEFKTFFESGNIRSFEKHILGKWIDTLFFYNDNGSINSMKYKYKYKMFFESVKNGVTVSKGQIKDTFLINWWNYYSNSGELDKKVEYLIIDKKKYFNQVISYNKEKEIIKDSSNYLTIDFPDTIPTNKLVIGSVLLYPNLSKEDNFHKLFFSYSHVDDNFNDLKKELTTGRNNKPAMIWAKFKFEGNKKIKGYILEQKRTVEPNKKDTSMVDIILTGHKMYFEKNIFVKDSVSLNSKYEYKKTK